MLPYKSTIWIADIMGGSLELQHHFCMQSKYWGVISIRSCRPPEGQCVQCVTVAISTFRLALMMFHRPTTVDEQILHQTEN